ncbi:cytochrome c oxidase subunit 1 [Halohasta litchfieldiae]|jgi:cytochrome c oxidase subunit 1|uniref:Cytochrome c oxidase subunit 1 n=1 Tax=Halohasta litchfieldiae TaxID=1073996 RepID=A0A1H6UI55_9EURY|nr:cbb3-type cytochrome c oxidase subunit I [Halohasta litchfieldiae]ATW89071.1 cytochrome c oxidase subunit 1 [Halohasta litchfieldiae]SEI87805.1 cytochrome c oxidase subunit 1 [Halohasta litchfieldiae]
MFNLAFLAVVTVSFVGGMVLLAWRASGSSDAKQLVSDGGFSAFLPGKQTGFAHKPDGLFRWLTTVDHKDIGILYIIFGTAAGLWGATDGMMIRAELFTPALSIWDASTYNAVFTMHGLTMLFFFVTPVFFGLANYFIPILLEAEDMAFPRINAIAFWLLPAAFLLARAGLITEVLGKMLLGFGIDFPVLLALEPPASGWTMYVPLSIQLDNPQMDLLLLGLHLSGLATVMGAINIVVTIFTMRGRNVTWSNLDIFSWTLLTTSGIVIFAFPLLGSALLMLLADRNFGTAFFTADGGAILWQHLFWFFGHPEVYILVLPAFGLVSYILPKFAGRRLFGFKFIVYSTLAIGVLSFGVWAHHMFATGIDPRLRASFMAISIAIAVPSAVKTFNWITTLWGGSIRLTAPMILCIGGVGTFIIGGVTGIFLASIPVDLVLHDTYYVVGHFHFIVVGVITFMAFAAGYFWFPLFTGRMYDRRAAKVHAYLTIVGVFTTFTPMLALGYLGLPRRRAAYPAEFEVLQQLSTFGAVLLIIGIGIWAINMFQSLRVGPKVTDADVWNLKETNQFSTEWQWFEQRLADKREDTSAVDTDSGASTGEKQVD